MHPQQVYNQVQQQQVNQQQIVNNENVNPNDYNAMQHYQQRQQPQTTINLQINANVKNLNINSGV